MPVYANQKASVIAVTLRLEDMCFTGRAASVASMDAGVKPARMYLRRVAAWPVELMSIHGNFRLHYSRNLIMDMNPDFLTGTAMTMSLLILYSLSKDRGKLPS